MGLHWRSRAPALLHRERIDPLSFDFAAQPMRSFANPKFLIRRLFRIAPLFWFGIILYCFVPLREDARREFEVGIWHYLATALFVHGWNVETMNSIVPGSRHSLTCDVVRVVDNLPHYRKPRP